MIRRKFANSKHSKRQAPDSTAPEAGVPVKHSMKPVMIRDDAHPNPGRAKVPLGPLLTVCDVASLLRVSRGTVYSWVNSGKIPYSRINSVVRFSSIRLEAWLEEREREPHHPVVQPENADNKTPRSPGPQSARTGVGRKRLGRTSRRQAARQVRDEDQARPRSKTKWLIDLDALRVREHPKS